MLPSIDVSALDTGDILLFSGKGLGSAIIRWFTGSDWTHVAIVVRLDGIDEPLLLESNPGLESADLFSGQPVAGISLVTLRRKLADYQGDVLASSGSAHRSRRACPFCRGWAAVVAGCITAPGMAQIQCGKKSSLAVAGR